MCGCSTCLGNGTLFCAVGVNNCLIVRLLKQKMCTFAKFGIETNRTKKQLIINFNQTKTFYDKN